MIVIVAQLRFDTQKGGIFWKLYFTIAGMHYYYGINFMEPRMEVNLEILRKWICDIMRETGFEYKGSAREDTVFNVLHDTPIYLQGIVVDINPIKAECSGTIEEYLKRC